MLQAFDGVSSDNAAPENISFILIKYLSLLFNLGILYIQVKYKKRIYAFYSRFV
jgi:hypothetical protein